MLWAFGDMKMLPINSIYALCRSNRRHNRLAHSHGFQNLVLDTPCNAKRSNDNISAFQPAANIVHASGDKRAIHSIQPQNFIRGGAPDDGKFRIRIMFQYFRHDLPRKTDNGIDIRAVIHLPGKDNQRAVLMAGDSAGFIRIIEIKINTITDSLDLPGIQTRTLPKQLRLRFAYKKRIVGTLSHFLFKGSEQFSFTPVYPSHWSRPRVR